jgi:hypothetical protein
MLALASILRRLLRSLPLEYHLQNSRVKPVLFDYFLAYKVNRHGSISACVGSAFRPFIEWAINHEDST